jgi:hypothetical protein
MAEKVLFIATVMNMLSGNAMAFAKTWTAGFSADRVKAGIDDALKTLPGMFDNFRQGVNSASASLAIQAEEAQELARRGIKVKEVTKDNTDLMGDYGGAVGGATRATDAAKQSLSAYTRQLETSVGAKASARRASLDLARADQTVAEAARNLTEAQQRFNRIVTGYGSESQQASDQQRELSRAQRDLERAGYDVERATFAVSDAEQALRELRADPRATAEQIREAEIALAEARLSIVDATDAQHEATISLNEAQRQLDITINGAREGSAEYTDALRDLTDAQRQYQDAIETQIDAREREAEAIKKVKEAEEELAKLRSQLPKGTKIDETTGAVVEDTKTNAYPSFMAAVRALHPNSAALKSSTPVAAARQQFPRLYDEYKKAGLALAKGGIVTQPTQALIGEAGAEAVIPLDRLSSLGTTNVYVTVNAGMGTDAARVGDEIVNVLQRYNRRNGALPLKIAV